jgi:hypothetical protein
MTDPKHPALLAAERWFATAQTQSDLAASARCLVKGWVDDTLRSLARIAFVAGYEAGRKARGETVAAFIEGEARRFDAASKNYSVMGATDSADRCSCKAGHSRTIAAQVARGDDEHPRD